MPKYIYLKLIFHESQWNISLYLLMLLFSLAKTSLFMIMCPFVHICSLITPRICRLALHISIFSLITLFRGEGAGVVASGGNPGPHPVKGEGAGGTRRVQPEGQVWERVASPSRLLIRGVPRWAETAALQCPRCECNWLGMAWGESGLCSRPRRHSSRREICSRFLKEDLRKYHRGRCRGEQESRSLSFWTRPFMTSGSLSY